MFVMHRSTAQLACRAGFVLFCLLPTCLTITWIAIRSQPGYVLSAKQEWEQVLSQKLGMRVTCASVEYPTPDTAELRRVEIVDAETGAPITSLATLDVVHDEQGWKLIGWQAVIEASNLPLAMDLLEQRWLRTPAGEMAPLAIELRELTVRDGNRSVTLVDLQGTWQPGETGPRGELQFRLPEAATDAARGRLVIERNRQTSPPTTRWQFETGALPMPASLATAGWPLVRRLGERAQFQGSVEYVAAATGSSGRVQGTLFEVDLDSLVTEQTVHQLSGVATCKIDDAVWEHGRPALLRGTLQSHGGGAVSRSLLAAGIDQLQLIGPSPESLAESTALVHYQQLSLGFDLRPEGLVLSGSADALRRGVLLTAATGPLLELPGRQQTTGDSLVRALFPEHEAHLPASQGAQALAGLLPARDSALHSTAKRLPAHVPTRLRDAGDPHLPVIRQPLK
jgi:hypothetical protein